jgi:hypothetical protein
VLTVMWRVDKLCLRTAGDGTSMPRLGMSDPFPKHLTPIS